MSQLKTAVGPDDHTQGPLDAPIVLLEYGDYECPYCGEAYPELKAVQKAMGDSLCFAFRNFPLGNAHPHAERAAEFAEAAATIGRFWEMHDALYEHQDELEDEHLARYAKRLGFDDALIESAMRGDSRRTSGATSRAACGAASTARRRSSSTGSATTGRAMPTRSSRCFGTRSPTSVEPIRAGSG